MHELASVKLGRVRLFIDAAACLADATHALGRRARSELPAVTGLSPEGVALALDECLERAVPDEDLETMVADIPTARRAHVLLSSNVFVGALRAIALGVATAPDVEVRASRREPNMVQLLASAAPGAFRSVDELAPLPGDHVWAYGSDGTMQALRGDLPAGVVLHANGGGIGVAVIDASRVGADDAAARLVDDVIPFDQRGCLSPRVVLVLGSDGAARSLVQATARELARREYEVPRGALAPAEQASLVRFRDTMLYAADLVPAGKGVIGYDAEGERLVWPPATRSLQVLRVDDAAVTLTALGNALTAIGVAGPDALRTRLAQAHPRCRVSELGRMQRPPLDGPVDRRPDLQGQVL